MAISLESVSSIFAAASSIGIAAFGLVDATKVMGGGISNAGFGYISKTLDALLPATGAGLTGPEVMATLRANWLNGVPKPDQKATAKSLIRMRLNEACAPELAKLTGVEPAALTEVARKVAAGEDLQHQDLNTLGRFDVVVSAKLDAAYERADQLYRNAAKVAASVIAVAISLAATPLMRSDAATSADYGLGLLVGVLAVPIAPIAKDLSSTLAQVVNSLRGIRR